MPRVCIAAAFACGVCAATPAADLPMSRAVSDARLDGVRGGYDLGDNLRASFALERTVLVNGVEAVRTQITVPDIANITRDQATALSAALRTTVVSTGPGTLVSTLPNSAAPGLIVQNSLDNQAISATTRIDASVNTARMLENMRIADAIHDAVIQYRGN